MKDGVLEQASKDIVIAYFVEKGLKPLGFDDLVFEKLVQGKLEIFDKKKGDPLLILGDRWEPIRARIFNQIKEFTAKPKDQIDAYMKEHESEFESVAKRYRIGSRMFKPGVLGHHIG